jgi:DNA polymerase-3 subunit beta
MKFSCEKAILQAAVNTAARAVSTKSSIPALEGILVEAGEVLRLTGYNLETGIRTEAEAEVSEAGSVVLNARLFSELVRRLPDDMVVFRSEGDNMHIKCGMSEFNLAGTAADEFPELPLVDDKKSIVIEERLLKALIGETLFAVSTNESRPIHTGSLFEAEDGRLTVVSVDGYRLALRREAAVTNGEGISFVVPGQALSEVEKIASDEEKMVTITIGNRHIMFSFGTTVLISRRLEGEFLDYKKAIPRSNPITVYGDCRQLLSSIERVSLIINEKMKSPLRCVFDLDSLKISTVTAIGSAADECPIQGDGQGLEIGFNNRYLIDALRYAPADRVRIEMNTGVSPCIILPEDGGDQFLYMVLPVRLKAGV